VLGAFADAEWALDHAVIEPGQQVVVVTDGIAEACGQGGRFGEERVRAQLGGASNPVQAVQRLEGALQSFTGGRLEDDVAILALAPASAEARASRGLSIASAQPVAGEMGFGAGGHG
jgi:serine phosphatase RsbU (regulator of sigma subunit)